MLTTRPATVTRPVITLPRSASVDEIRAALAPRFPELVEAWKREKAAWAVFQRAQSAHGDESSSTRDALSRFTHAWDAAYALVKATVELRFVDEVAS